MIRDLIEQRYEDINARNELVLHYSYLVDAIISKYFNSPNLDTEELRSVGIEALIKAIDSYEGEYPHYYFIKHCNDNIFYAISHVLSSLRFESKHFVARFEDTKLVEYGEYEEILDRIAFSELSVKYIEKLDSFDKNILKLYFGIGTRKCNDREISEIYGVTRSTISKRRLKIINELNRKLYQDNAALTEKTPEEQKNVDF